MLIVNPLPMQWEEGYRRVFPDAKWSKMPSMGHDEYLFMWCDKVTQDFINCEPKQGRYTVFIRRYEYYTELESVDWSKVDEVIMVNDFLAEGFERRIGRKPHVVYNGVDPSQWTFKERNHGKIIAWVGFINQKKNLPLAVQIMAELPRDYELHIAGELQDMTTMDYLEHMVKSLGIKVVWNGHINHEWMDSWLEDKNYILNTSISEGCPNSVIEAMAKGIKPVVYNWPGALQQFGAEVIEKANDAVIRITDGGYETRQYRARVERKFGLSNYEKVREIVEANA